MQPDTKIDALYAFYRDLCEHLQTVVPFTKGATGTLDLQAWLTAVDTRCEVHQLRTFLLTHTTMIDALGAVLGRFIDIPQKNDSDKKKIDLLLVHYLAQSMSSEDVDLTLEHASRFLEPVLGPTAAQPLPILTSVSHELDEIRSLSELLDSKILDRVQRARIDHNDYRPAAMAVFAWIGLLTRRTCVRLLMSDLDHIENGLRQLNLSGMTHLDCTTLGLGHKEGVNDLMQKCEAWKRPFPGKYRNESWFRDIAALRNVTESALLVAVSKPHPAVPAFPDAIEEEAIAPAKELAQAEASRMEAIVSEIGSALESVRSSDFARVQIGRIGVLLASAEIRAFRSSEAPAAALPKEVVALRVLLAAPNRPADPAQCEKTTRMAAETLAAIQSAIAAAARLSDHELAVDLRRSARALEKVLAQ